MEKQIPHSFCLAVKLGSFQCTHTQILTGTDLQKIPRVPDEDIKVAVRGVVCYKCNYNYWFHFYLDHKFTPTCYTLPDAIFYTANNSMHCLESVFHDRMWLWSPWLPDPNPCDLYLWDMLNDEVYSNNTCSEHDLKRDTQSADPTISPAEPSLFLKYGKNPWSNQWYGTNYGPFRAWLKPEKFLWKCQFGYTKRPPNEQAVMLPNCFGGTRSNLGCDYPDSGIVWFSSVPPGKFQDSSSN
jgi:hypothetical protein